MSRTPSRKKWEMSGYSCIRPICAVSVSWLKCEQVRAERIRPTIQLRVWSTRTTVVADLNALLLQIVVFERHLYTVRSTVVFTAVSVLVAAAADPATGTARYSSPERRDAVPYQSSSGHPSRPLKGSQRGQRPDRLNLSKQNWCVVEMPPGPVDPVSAATT